MRILLIRTDSIGDVVLTLPMASLIKDKLPDAEVYFMGKTYTKDIVNCHQKIDGFLNWDELSGMDTENAIKTLKAYHFDVAVHVFPVKEIGRLIKMSAVPQRISTAGRLYMWPYCNKRIRFSRKKSDLHEAQLNFKLLQPLGFDAVPSLKKLGETYADIASPPVSEELRKLIDPTKKNIILHPKSKGSAVEWGLENFNQLAALLPKDKYRVFISGTKEDAEAIGNAIPFDTDHVISLLGKLSLSDFIAFISLCDGLVAASTGPLHIASALGKRAVGLYSSRRPIHPGRWMPIGLNSVALVYDENCAKCASGAACNCIQLISPERVMSSLED